MDWSKLWGAFSRKPKGAPLGLGIEKRRSERVAITMPVFVYGRAQGKPFSERTETANVSAQGGLVALSVDLDRSQTLLVTNLQTDEDLACRVARLARNQAGKKLVAVEFLQPAPRFWSIDFSDGPPR